MGLRLLFCAVLCTVFSAQAGMLPFGVQCDLASYRSGAACQLGANTADGQFFDADIDLPGVASASMSGFVRGAGPDVGIELDLTAQAYDQYFARGRAFLTVGWTDSVVVSHDGLANGAPLSISIQHDTNVALPYLASLKGRFSTARVTQNFFSELQAHYTGLDDVTSRFEDRLTLRGPTASEVNHRARLDAAVRNGSTINLSYLMFAEFSFELSQPADNIPEASTLYAGVLSGNSGHVYLSSSDSAVAWLSSSGFAYTAAPAQGRVPAPGSLPLSFGALALCALACRKPGPSA